MLIAVPIFLSLKLDLVSNNANSHSSTSTSNYVLSSSLISPTLDGAINSSTETITFADASSFAVGDVFNVDSENMVIRAISGNDVTATRSVNGTSAATHLNGATVSTVAKNITLESISAGSSPNINSVRLYIEGSGTAAPAPTLGGDLSDSATSTTLSSTSNIERGDTLTINSEKVLVLGGVPNTLTSSLMLL